MKKQYRIVALIAAAILMLGLTACGGKDPLATALENMNTAENMDAVTTMNMEMEMAGETIKAGIRMDMTMFTEPIRMKVDTTTEMAGQSFITSIYAEEASDGSYMMYTNNESNWYPTSVSAEDLSQYEINQIMSAYIDSASNFHQEGLETVDGISAYKYAGVITGQNVKDIMLVSNALDSMSGLGIGESQMEDMLSDLGDIPVTLWISQSDLYPIRCYMDMTAVMDGLMKDVLGTLGSEAEDMTMSISEMTITMACSNFNNATEFSIPNEAEN